MEFVLEKVKCFFNFRSPYAYLGVKKAIEESIDMEFFPLCYMPKEIVEFLLMPQAMNTKDPTSI